MAVLPVTTPNENIMGLYSYWMILSINVLKYVRGKVYVGVIKKGKVLNFYCRIPWGNCKTQFLMQ